MPRALNDETVKSDEPVDSFWQQSMLLCFKFHESQKIFLAFNISRDA